MNTFIPPANTRTYPIDSEAPQWFVDNLHQAGESHVVEIVGCRAHFLAWNWERTELPALIFVHGFGGHAHWWSFIAPFFTQHFRILALDLPGMGDSGPPREYHDSCFAEVIIGLIKHYQLQEVTIISHSFGGVQTMRAMMMQPELFSHCIIVDSMVNMNPEQPIPIIPARGTHKYTNSREECLQRFRLMPPQPDVIPSLEKFIGHYSCIESEQGWHWKFDPNVRNFGEINDLKALRKISARVDCIYGELSMFNVNDLPTKVLNSFSNHGDLIMINNAHHHIMLDHPLELVEAINKLLDASA